MASPRRTKIAVGMSGGVDSSVAALLLAERGHRVSGIAMRIFDASMPAGVAGGHACYGPEEEDDLESARAVCRKLRIPFHVIDLRKEFRSHVIEYFRSAYLAGETPNPCAVCNHKLKFGFLLKEARASGVEFARFATGHYARLDRSSDRFLLKRAADRSKDQSYFLFSLSQEQLSEVLFPLGDLTKQKVREIARSAGLNTAERAESQDFVSGDYGSFFSKDEMKEGPIVDRQGRVLGTHRGIVHYTVGQRRGLGIAAGAPMYITRIDAPQNRIIVEGREGLLSGGLVVKDLNLISVDILRGPMQVQAKIRLQHRPAEARLIPYKGSGAAAIFEQPQQAVTPGQSVVFYQGDTVVGGGTIERAI